MIKRENKKIILNVITECMCDKCNAEFIPENIQEIDPALKRSVLLSGIIIKTTAGYSSKSDGTSIEIALCENCLLNLQESLIC